MSELFSEKELTEKCEEVFDLLGLTKTEVSDMLDVSDVAVHYMINEPEKGMSGLRKRFLDRFGGIEVKGKGYVADDSGAYLTPQQVCDEFGLPWDAVDEAIEEGELEMTDDLLVPYASALGFALRYEHEEGDE